MLVTPTTRWPTIGAIGVKMKENGAVGRGAECLARAQGDELSVDDVPAMMLVPERADANWLFVKAGQPPCSDQPAPAQATPLAAPLADAAGAVR